MTEDAFLRLAERQISAPRKARQRAAEKRAMTRAEKALSARDYLLRAYRRRRQKRFEVLFAGSHGDMARELSAFLVAMALTDGDRLIKLVRAGRWQQADADTRFEVLGLVDHAIASLLERNGLGKPHERAQIPQEARRRRPTGDRKGCARC